MRDWIIGGGAVAFLAMAGLLFKKYGPALVDKIVGGAVRQAIDFDEGNPLVNEARKNIILWNMIYLELKMPDRGQGLARKEKILAMFGLRAGPIVEELLFQLDDEMKKLTTELKRGIFEHGPGGPGDIGGAHS